MRFVYDEVQPVGLIACSICKRFPDGILSSIRVLGEIARFAEFLRIEKIDMPVFQHLTIKAFVADGNALIQTDFVRLGIYFESGLLVELRRIRKPHKYGVRLIRIHLVAVVDALDQRSHDNRLTRTGGGRVGNDLRGMGTPVIAQRSCGVHAQLGKRNFLKREQFDFHCAYLLTELMRKLSR